MADGGTRSLSEVLDTLKDAGDGEEVTVGEINAAFGDRSLAPVLLVPALITASPVSGIPGVPTVTGIVVGLIVVQMIAGRTTLWLPRFLAERGIAKARLERAVGFLRRPVGWVERLMRPRLAWLTERPWNYLALFVCLAIAVLAPALELLPFVISVAATAIALFAAGILVRDGAVMLAGYGLVGLAGWLAWALA